MKRTLQRLVPLAALTGVLSAATPTIADNAETKARLESLASSVGEQLAATNGKTIYVMTDKPLYHPGEAIWFRAWELSVKTLAAAPGDHGVTFQLLDARGAKVMEKRVLSTGGVATNDFRLARRTGGVGGKRDGNAGFE